MKGKTDKRILAGVEPTDLVGREAELERLLAHAKGTSLSDTIVVLSAPRVGASELLRQAYDSLFVEQEAITPFYFEIKSSDSTAANAALRFATDLLTQTVAFRRRDPKIISSAPGLSEIAELASPSDGYWIDRLTQAVANGDKTDDRAFIRTCLSAPLRAAANGSQSFVIIDGVQDAGSLAGGTEWLDELLDVFSRSPVPVVFSGLRRFLFRRLQGEIIDLDPFDLADAGKFVENSAKKLGVSINDQTRDLIAVQLGGNAADMTSLFRSAAANDDALTSFDDVERVYTDEIFGGHIGRRLDAIMRRTGATSSVLRLLAENMNSRLPVAYWKKHAGLGDDVFDRAMEMLHVREIINIDSGSVTIDGENTVLRDYIDAGVRLEINGQQRALAVGEALIGNRKRATALMARRYRQSAAIDLRELMPAFDGRQISPALIDYARFKAELKGADEDKLRKALKEDNARFRLPQISFTAHAAAFYPRISDLCDVERSAIGIGFADGARKKEVAWLAAEIESKLEAAADVTEFWCDRLEMAAANCNFEHFKIWLIAPEGFSPEAVEILKARNAIGSSRRQVELLAETLNTEIAPAAVAPAASEYEFVIPMGSDGELLTARSIDEIARRHDLPPRTTNQIKTALIEACINAAEHSLSPDGKIHQKFVLDDEKITITVTNRGVRLADKSGSGADAERRGWGLKLIRGLMDTVDLEQTDDGTRITMTKSIRRD